MKKNTQTTFDALYQQFQQVVQKHPQLVAIHLPDGAITYHELHQSSDQIAHYLCQQEITSIGLSLAPCKAYFIMLVGAMKAGCLVYPMDPESPTHTTHIFQHKVDAESWPEIIQASQHFSLTFKPQCLTDKQPLHCTQTSGSTGTPSYVTHARVNIFQHRNETAKAYNYTPKKVHLSLARHTSTAGINAFWRLLLTGHSSVFFDLRKTSLHKILERFKSLNVGSLHGAPSILRGFVNIAGLIPCSYYQSLDTLITGGERVSVSLLKSLAEIFPKHCRLQVNYSSTETMHICYYNTHLHQATLLTQIPCGTPFDSREVILLNDQKKPTSTGSIGEIVVRSKFLPLALKTTKPQLFTDAHDSDYQLYFTGDLGRWNEQGLLEHCGRKDRQLKMNGVRIDPLQLENALLNIKNIKDVRVFMSSDEHNPRLIACTVQEKPHNETTTLLQHLQKRFPSSAIPTHFINVAEIPLLATGKTDNNALLALYNDSQQLATKAKPLNSQTRLHKAWENALGRSLPLCSQTFTEAGGDSLKALKLIATLEEWGFKNITLKWIYQHPTISAQMHALQTQTPALSVKEKTALATYNRTTILQKLGWNLVDSE